MALNRNKNVILTPKAEGSRPKFLHVALCSIALLLAACGDEVTEVTRVVGMQVVEEGESMPKCTTEKEGQMVYSVDSAAAYYCINRKWTSMKGEDGKDGKNGENGANGEKGSDGTSCTAVEIDDGYKIVCGGDSVGVVLNGAKGDKGEKGKDGDNGNDGEKGSDGTSCTAEAIDGGYKIVCGDDSVGVVLNGKDGEDGADGKSFVDGWMVDPRDKQLYRVVTIGEQTWMAENLNYQTDSSWCGGGDGENEGDCSKYGRLYTWAAAIDSASLYKDKTIDCGYDKTCSLPDTVYGICPPGWHLPDSVEWKKLFTAVGGESNASMILKSQTGWKSSGNGTDIYGFSAFPAGSRYDDGGFVGNGTNADFWSAAEKDSCLAYGMSLSSFYKGASLNNYKESFAISVRCLKDQQ